MNNHRRLDSKHSNVTKKLRTNTFIWHCYKSYTSRTTYCITKLVTDKKETF